MSAAISGIFRNDRFGRVAMEVTIERLGREGDGIAGALRLPFALPGERWRVGEGAPALLAAAPERVEPPCPHFGACGGCALQHAADGFVSGWKAGTIARALAARGLAAPVRPTATSPAGSRRRAVFAGRRTRKGAAVGFFGRRSDALVEVPGCLVVRPEIVAARPALAALTARGASRSGTLRLIVTHGPAGLDVAVAGGKPLDAGLRQGLAALAEEADLARLAWEGEVLALRRPPVQPMGRALVVPPPGAFLQATAEGADGAGRGGGRGHARGGADRRPLRRLRDAGAAAGGARGGAGGGGGCGDAGGARRRRPAGAGAAAGGGGGARPLPPAAAGGRARRLRRGGDRPAARRGRGAEPRDRRGRACRGWRRCPAIPRPSPATRGSSSTAASGSTGCSRSTSSAGPGTWKSPPLSAGKRPRCGRPCHRAAPLLRLAPKPRQGPSSRCRSPSRAAA